MHAHIKNKIMKTTELKKLAKEFSEFLVMQNDIFDIDVEKSMREFWHMRFGVSNAEREQELLDFWYNQDKK